MDYKLYWVETYIRGTRPSFLVLPDPSQHPEYQTTKSKPKLNDIYTVL
jgi:hypothetical protein